MGNGGKLSKMQAGISRLCDVLIQGNIPFVLGKWNGTLEMFPTVVTPDKVADAKGFVAAMAPQGGSDMCCALLRLLSKFLPPLSIEVSDVHVICGGGVRPFIPRDEYPVYNGKDVPNPNRSARYIADYNVGWLSFRRRFPHVKFHFHGVGEKVDNLSLSTMAMSGDGSSSTIL